MQYGFNLLLWTGHVTDEHAPVLKALKKTGYDNVEIPIFEGTPDYYARLGERLAKLGFDVTTVSVLGAGQNCLADDKAERKAAVERAKWVDRLHQGARRVDHRRPDAFAARPLHRPGPDGAGAQARHRVPPRRRRLCRASTACASRSRR